MNTEINKLFGKDVLKAFEEQGYTGDKNMSQIKIVCKLFNPIGVGTWWLYEHIEEDIYMAFCLLSDPSDAEIGSISLDEMMAVKLPLGLKIERDKSFQPFSKTLEEVYNEIKGR